MPIMSIIPISYLLNRQTHSSRVSKSVSVSQENANVSFFFLLLFSLSALLQTKGKQDSFLVENLMITTCYVKIKKLVLLA